MVDHTKNTLFFRYMRNSVIALLFLISFIGQAQVRFYNINETFGVSMRETASTRIDGSGFVWVSSKTGILRLTDDDYRIYQLPYETWNVITVKLEYQNTDLFAITNNGQLFVYNKVQDRFDLIVNLARELNDPFLTISNKVIDQKGRIWIASGIGLIMYENGNIHHFDEQGQISYVEWYDDQRVILAGLNELSLFNINSRRVETLFSENIIGQLGVSKLFFEQHSGNIWIGTESLGIYVLNTTSKELDKVYGIPMPTKGAVYLRRSRASLEVIWEEMHQLR